jgi:hypothetical protein
MNEYGQPTDTEEALREQSAAIDAEIAADLAGSGDDSTDDVDWEPAPDDATGDIPAELAKAKTSHNAEPVPESPEAKLLGEIVDANCEVCRLEALHLVDAEYAKQSKKSWEAAAKSLSKLIAKSGEKYPLFDREEHGAPSTAPESASEEWREVAIDILGNHGLSGAIIAKLIEVGIETIGHMADWTAGTGLYLNANGTGRPLTDLSGIGKAKAEKIEAALESFWRKQAVQEVFTPTAGTIEEVTHG